MADVAGETYETMNLRTSEAELMIINEVSNENSERHIRSFSNFELAERAFFKFQLLKEFEVV
jgi:hypothetical protein